MTNIQSNGSTYTINRQDGAILYESPNLEAIVMQAVLVDSLHVLGYALAAAKIIGADAEVIYSILCFVKKDIKGAGAVKKDKLDLIINYVSGIRVMVRERAFLMLFEQKMQMNDCLNVFDDYLEKYQ